MPKSVSQTNDARNAILAQLQRGPSQKAADSRDCRDQRLAVLPAGFFPSPSKPPVYLAPDTSKEVKTSFKNVIKELKVNTFPPLEQRIAKTPVVRTIMGTCRKVEKRILADGTFALHVFYPDLTFNSGPSNPPKNPQQRIVQTLTRFDPDIELDENDFRKKSVDDRWSEWSNSSDGEEATNPAEKKRLELEPTEEKTEKTLSYSVLPSCVQNEIKTQVFLRKQAKPAKHLCLCDIFSSKDGPLLLAPWAEAGNLKKYLSNSFKESKELRQNLALQVCESLCELHALNIVHGDVKLMNYLVFLDENRQPLLRLADFDMSDFYLIKKKDEELVGSDFYRALEHYDKKNKTIGRKSDIFAAGVVLAKILKNIEPEELGGIPLHKGDIDHFTKTLNKNIVEVLKGDDPVSHTLRSCLATHPKDRPSAPELLERLQNQFKVKY